MTTANAGGFQFTPPTGLLNTTSYPTTPANETAARQQFMDLFYQLMNEINAPTAAAAAYGQYNKLINGNFDIWQRGISWTNPASGICTADRWKLGYTADTGTFPTLTHSQQIQVSGDILGSYLFYRIAAAAAGTTSAAQYNFIIQKIENGTRYLSGAGKKVTVSFWARSSIAGKRIGLDLAQEYGSGGTPSAAELISGSNWTLSSTWTKYSYTFTTNTLVGKTFGTNNDDGITIELWTAWGTNFIGRVGASTAESFSAAGNIDIAQVQVNVGDQTLPFQPKSISDEDRACKRYFRRLGFGAVGRFVTASNIEVAASFETPMRTAPTIVLNKLTPSANESGVATRTATGATLGYNLANQYGYDVTITGFAGGTAGNTAILQDNAIDLDSEL